jgi:hypothetical protein
VRCRKVTEPIGVGPWCLRSLTAAVKVTGRPRFAGLGYAVRTVRVGAVPPIGTPGPIVTVTAGVISLTTRHRCPGHLLQGRFKSKLVEDESYFWSVSRYIHLNPLRDKRPLVAHPREWRWSSFPGYASRRARVHWVAYDFVYAAWQGDVGGRDPETAYRRYVE